MAKKLLTLITLILTIGLLAAACPTSSPAEGGATTSAAENDSEPIGTGAAEVAHLEEGDVNGILTHHDGEVDEGEHHAVELLVDHGHDSPAGSIPGTREVTLTANEWEFAPAVVTAKVGKPVTIVLVNDGVVEHDVEFANFGLHLHTEVGESLKGSFVPDKVGTFEFACEIPGHRLAGMVGKLVVTD